MLYRRSSKGMKQCPSQDIYITNPSFIEGLVPMELASLVIMFERHLDVDLMRYIYLLCRRDVHKIFGSYALRSCRSQLIPRSPLDKFGAWCWEDRKNRRAALIVAEVLHRLCYYCLLNARTSRLSMWLLSDARSRIRAFRVQLLPSTNT